MSRKLSLITVLELRNGRRRAKNHIETAAATAADKHQKIHLPSLQIAYLSYTEIFGPRFFGFLSHYLTKAVTT